LNGAHKTQILDVG